MEIRDFAHPVLTSATLEGKLRPPPPDPTDERPGPAARILAPTRPPELEIVSSRRARTPSIEGMADPAQKVRILHAFANHELQAVELFAFALLAFPEAPRAFRRGLLGILAEEQRHCRLYIDRLAGLGARFGDFPVSGYFWSKADTLTTPARFVASMGLTFESANLDYAADYARAARRHGDEETAAAIELVHAEEIGHVRFGWTWLDRFRAPDQTMSEAYLENVTWPLRPRLARGPVFDPESRRAAGMDEEFVRMLADAERDEAGGP